MFDAPTPTTAIAKEAVSPIIQNLPDEECADWPDDLSLWQILKAAVAELTDYNDRFVEFTVEVQKLPDGDRVS